MMLFSVGAGVGFGVGDFEGAPVVGFLVGLGVGGLEGGPVVGGFVGWNERVYKVQSTQEMIEICLLAPCASNVKSE